MFGVGPRRDAAKDAGQSNFEQVIWPHLDAAYNLARWLLRNDHDAEDAVQEAFLRAYKAFDRFRGGDGKAWLMTILRNVCYTRLQKSQRLETTEPFDEEIHQALGGSAEQAAFRQKANAETLHRALDHLPAEFREIIVLHDLEGLAYKEIAAVAGIPIGTVMSRLARARARLRAEISSAHAKEAS
jgi:RNA polymerase sigma-70 factor (ECF subfamily)